MECYTQYYSATRFDKNENFFYRWHISIWFMRTRFLLVIGYNVAFNVHVCARTRVRFPTVLKFNKILITILKFFVFTSIIFTPTFSQWHSRNSMIVLCIDHRRIQTYKSVRFMDIFVNLFIFKREKIYTCLSFCKWKKKDNYKKYSLKNGSNIICCLYLIKILYYDSSRADWSLA